MPSPFRIAHQRRVVVLALPGTYSLDAMGPFEIFHAAARLHGAREQEGRVDPGVGLSLSSVELAYDVELVGARTGKVETAGGVGLFATRALSSVRGPLDTFIVAGGNIERLLQVLADKPQVLANVQRVARLSRRVASVCSGSFVLAAAGLLDGRRATTHWAACDLLQKRFPKLRVERDPIYTRDGNVYTSAGATTGMDLALALVRDDHGRELAQEVARWLVLYVQRPGSQSQLSASLRAQEAEREPLRDLKTWIIGHPSADLSVTALAARAGMSVRNFARAFRRELSVTPASYVEAVRVEAARQRLQLGVASIEEIAVAVGFGSVVTLRRAFARQLGVSPAEYRARVLHVAS